MITSLVQRTKAFFLGRPVLPPPAPRGKPPMRIIRNDGRVFSSQHAAARLLGVNQGAISAHLAGKVKHVRGYTFQPYSEGGLRG